MKLLTFTTTLRIGNSFCEESSWEISECGNWQKHYTDLHKSITQGLSPKRFLVSVPLKGGLADTIIGIVSQFLFALLTERAFLRLNLDFLDEVFVSPNINLNVSFVIPLLYQHMWNNECKEIKRNVVQFNNSNYYIMCATNNYTFMNHIYTATNFSTLPMDHRDIEVILFSSNRGRIISIFQNPFYRKTLLNYGLRPETCFACLFHYLFRIRNNTVCNTISCQNVKSALLQKKSEGVIIIGIQLRFPDITFLSNSFFYRRRKVAFSFYTKHFFDCANQYATSLESTQKYIFFLVSNSLLIRKIASRKYGKMLITDTTTMSSHTGKIFSYYITFIYQIVLLLSNIYHMNK